MTQIKVLAEHLLEMERSRSAGALAIMLIFILVKVGFTPNFLNYTQSVHELKALVQNWTIDVDPVGHQPQYNKPSNVNNLSYLVICILSNVT